MKIKFDAGGLPFEFPEDETIPWQERAKIRSEINTNYAKYDGKRFAIHRSYGLDDIAYLYFFENRGFDDINIYRRIENL